MLLLCDSFIYDPAGFVLSPAFLNVDDQSEFAGVVLADLQVHLLPRHFPKHFALGVALHSLGNSIVLI